MNDSSISVETTHHDTDLPDADQSTQSPDNTSILRMVSDRTIELARLDGRQPHQIRQIDYERAKREVAEWLRE